MTTILRSGLRCMTSLRSPNNTSVASVLSCASSSTITAYLLRVGSPCASRRSIPSVMYLRTVLELLLSSNRMLYPTSSPKFTSSSSATRFATLIAATRLGCVHAMSCCGEPPKPCSNNALGICVVFPEPVSPSTTTT